MRSSSGAHFIALDHVRALAAFIVFTWHFIHAENGYPVAFNYVPAIFPFAILDEGHTGVALFMTLSGYLFAKLLDGKSIDYGAFIWNRALRLLPLLIFVILLVGITRFIYSQNLSDYAQSIAKGALYPTLPNGGWSITVEFHYYIILPFLLWMSNKFKLLSLFSILAAAIALRLLLYHERGEIQSLAYWTIIGRLDQFVLGMLFFQLRSYITCRHVTALLAIAIFMLIYWYFDLRGGFYQNPSYPSPNPLWIILPTIEGVAYAIAIAWYESSFNHPATGISKLKIGVRFQFLAPQSDGKQLESDPNFLTPISQTAWADRKIIGIRPQFPSRPNKRLQHPRRKGAPNLIREALECRLERRRLRTEQGLQHARVFKQAVQIHAEHVA